MRLIQHLKTQQDLYMILCTWAAVGAFVPNVIAVVYSGISFLLILRSKNLTKILIALLAMLMFSDSRSMIFEFAETAKILLVVMTIGFMAVNFKTLTVRKNAVFVAFLPFLIYSVLSSLWAHDVFTGFQKSISYASIFFLIPLIYLNGKRQNSSISVELVYFFLVIIGVGLILHSAFPSLTTLVGRYRGLLGNPNGLGIFLTLVYATYYALRKQGHADSLGKKFHIMFFLLFIPSLLLTGSRTALISVLIYFLFDRLRYFSNALAVLIFISLIASYEYLLVQLPNLIQFMELSDFFRLETLEGGSGRFVAWSFAWEQIQENFFFGGGFGYTEYIYHAYHDQLSRLGHQGNAHNSYLTLWLNTGFVGVVLYAWGFVTIVVKGLKTFAFTLPVIFGVIFSTYFESWLSASLNPFTSIFIIILSVILYSENGQQIEKSI
jgi:O-antigen ligase